MRRFRFGLLGLATAGMLALSLTSPAQAEVTHVSEQGFAVLHLTKINAPPEKVWATLIAPQSFWSSSHSWSGDAANLYLDAQAGGCFCEKIPAKSGDGGGLNSVEHMRVIYSERPRVLRMSGALGPLQSEGVIGTLNIAMEANGDGTKISMSYVVGGYMRMKPADIAPAVDAVLGEQLLRLKARAEGRDPATVVWPPKKADAPAPVGAVVPVKDAPKAGGSQPVPVSPNPAVNTPKPVGATPPSSTPSAKAEPAKTESPKVTPLPAQPASTAPDAKPPLGDRLKATDSGAETSPTAEATTSPKRKPIVEDAPKLKPAAIPPGSR